MLFIMGNICGIKKPADDPTVDLVTGLTHREQQLIKKLWHKVMVKETMKGAGTKLLLDLFIKCPRLKENFKDIAHCEIQDLNNNIQFRAFAISYVMVLTAYVECVDDPEILAAIISKNSVQALKRGFQVQDMETGTKLIVKFLKEEGDKEATPEALAAWEKLLKYHNTLYREKAQEMLARDAANDSWKKKHTI